MTAAIDDADGGVEVEQIATTEDTGDPVHEVRLGDAWATVLAAEDRLFVYYVEAMGDVRMADLLDATVDHFGISILQFMSPLDDLVRDDPLGLFEDARETTGEIRTLSDALHGFKRATWTAPTGETVECLVGRWSP